jgi:hypothetical protein
MTTGRGAFTGLLSGIIGSFVWLIVSIVVNVLMAPLQRRIAEDIARNGELPPEVRTMLESFGANPTIGLVVGFIVMLFCGAIFGTIGGLLGAAFFRHDVPPALGGPSEPPPLPPQ